LQLFLGDFDLGHVADMAQQQPQKHAPFGDIAIFGFQDLFVLFLIFLVDIAFFLGLGELRPDLVKFACHHAFRHFKVMLFKQDIQQFALGLGTGQFRIFAFNPAAHLTAQIIQ